MIVIMILSEKAVDMTSVCMPSMVPAACLVMAGYDEEMLGTWGESGAIGSGISVAAMSDRF